MEPLSASKLRKMQLSRSCNLSIYLKKEKILDKSTKKGGNLKLIKKRSPMVPKLKQEQGRILFGKMKKNIQLQGSSEDGREK